MNRRFLSALECGSWCLVVAAAVASTAVLSGGNFKTLDALLFFAYPISACMLLIVLAAITPGFLPKDRIRFPVNLSVPILFAVLLLALLNLSITQDTALAKVPEAFALAQR